MIKYSKNGYLRTLSEDLILYTNRFKDVYFVSDFLIIENNKIIIKAGFQWNGCNLVKDCRKTDIGCCVHDALLMYSVPINRKTKDLIMLDNFREDKFQISYFYYLGVRGFAIVRLKG